MVALDLGYSSSNGQKFLEISGAVVYADAKGCVPSCVLESAASFLPFTWQKNYITESFSLGAGNPRPNKNHFVLSVTSVVQFPAPR